MRRSTFLAAATATALSASLFTGTAPAHADGTTGGPVLSDADGWYEPGLLFVTAHSDSPLTHITAHFYPLNAPAGTQETGSTEDFTQYTGEDARSGVWRAPVHLPELGDYRVTVDLQDASGATVTEAVSPHSLRYQTVITLSGLTATPSVPDYLHQEVSVSGAAVARDPRDPGTPAPAAGIPIAVGGAGRTWSTTTTGADGRFTAAFVPTTRTFRVYTWPEASDSYPGAIDLGSDPQDLHTAPAPIRFTASTHALNLQQGAAGTVTGHAEVQTTSGWQPLPHTTITLQDRAHVAGQTTTDNQGNYTLHVPSSGGGATSGELVAGTYDMPFQLTATQPFSLHVAYTTHIGLSASLDDDGALRTHGYVSYEDTRAHWPAHPTVTLQYSKDGKSSWKDAATVPVPIHHNKPLFDETFTRTLTKPDTDAYWRARFNGNPDLGTSTTKPVHLYRYATRITGFHASTDPVRKGQPFRFAGTAQYKKGTTWKPLQEGPTLYFKPRGSTTYHYVCELGSDHNGHLTGWVTAKQDGTWAVAYSRQTGDHYLASTKVTDYVDVR
ncbi:hypothetical protein ACWD4F_17170 [Streptomyces aureus]